MPVVSLVGYTSSGKTTLFNTLTNESKQTSHSLFTTLSTTTRALELSDRHALLTDTVGFINRLPTYMIDAFKSTLEESLAADLVLLLIDASEDLRNIRIKFNACWQVLDELSVERTKVATVFTKYDQLGSEALLKGHATDLQVQEPVAISSTSGYGMHKLKTMIRRRVEQETVEPSNGGIPAPVE
jgi:GTP-binding protein HflX